MAIRRAGRVMIVMTTNLRLIGLRSLMSGGPLGGGIVTRLIIKVHQTWPMNRPNHRKFPFTCGLSRFPPRILLQFSWSIPNKTNFIYYTYLDIILLIDLIISTFYSWPWSASSLGKRLRDTRKGSDIFRVELFSQVKLVRVMLRKRKHTLSIFVLGQIAWQGGDLGIALEGKQSTSGTFFSLWRKRIWD